MGMYCCCEQKIRDGFICNCDWTGWISIYDWPPERKNKELPFALPVEDGKYYVRFGTGSGDRCESVQFYSKKPRKSNCGYTGKEVWLHWSGNDEKQPFAWRELRDEDEY